MRGSGGTTFVKETKRTQTDNSDSISSATTNSVITQYGWGQKIGDGSANITETVTFPTAFTTVMGVVIGLLDFKSNPAATDITGLTSAIVTSGGVTIAAGAITTSQFTMRMSRSSGTFGATTYHGYSWIAWGI